MNNKKIFLLVITLLMMAGTATALTWLRANQRLGTPAIKGTPIPGSVKIDIHLPENVAGYTSTNMPEPETVLGYLPKDTSYAERIYHSPDGFWIQSTAILMGADRTSIHRPDFCLPGQGWSIDEKQVLDIPINDQPPYHLQAAAWKVSQMMKDRNGEKIKVAGVYVYWYVANNEETPDHDKMIEHLTLDLLRKGALQRWSYISYFAVCLPGQEDAAIDRITRFIATQAPEFQLPVKPL
ncbi:MAG TPA: exosortase-associated EpsI family protein [Pseudomonadales bacterium]|nr:exosortase-associated EpsI family protein [Pseudomonadales bacterium]